MRGDGRGCGVSANEYSRAHHLTWGPIKFGDLPPYLTYGAPLLRVGGWESFAGPPLKGGWVGKLCGSSAAPWRMAGEHPSTWAERECRDWLLYSHSGIGRRKDDTILQCLTLRHKNTHYSETLLIMTQCWYPACYKYNTSLETSLPPLPPESNNWDLEGTVREQLGIQAQTAEEDREPPPLPPHRPAAPRVCTYSTCNK